ncbi:MAG: SAF domain-containing protein [Stackebrandtia sp.]
MAALFVVTLITVDEKREVLVAATPIAAGQKVTTSDVTSTRLAGADDIDAVAADNARVLSGAVAAYPLAAGTILTRQMIADNAAYPHGDRAHVALSLEPGRIPAATQPGANVTVYAPQPNKEADPQTVHAVVTNIDNGDKTVVSVECDAADVPTLAAAEPQELLVAHVATGK